MPEKRAEKCILGLREWREERGISLETVAVSTKLSVTILCAIECGQFTRLPGGIYNTNYIRQYSRAIGFPEDELLSAYRNWCHSQPPSLVMQYS